MSSACDTSNDLLDLLDGGHCLCTNWMISMGFGIFLMFGISLCLARETIDAVGCTTGVFTTVVLPELNLKYPHCSVSGVT